MEKNKKALFMAEVKLEKGFLFGDHHDYEVMNDTPLNADVQNSFADLYLARKIKTGKLFALKVLRPSMVMKHRILLDYFKREIRFLKKLDHQNIVRIEDFGKLTDLNNIDCYYLMMEYVEGDLKGRFSITDYLKFTMQVCDGLMYLHKNNVIHRDIKPDNILLYSTNLVKIADFGIARLFEEGESVSTVAGSPPYAAPEQMKRQGNITPAADIYALGKTLYSLITKKVPESGEQITELPEKFKEKIWCSAVEEILKKATEPDPENRYKDALEMKIAVGKLFRKKKEKAKKIFIDKKAGIIIGTLLVLVAVILSLNIFPGLMGKNNINNPESLKEEASVLFSMGSPEYFYAERNLMKYLNYNPEDFDSRFLLGWIYFEKGYYSQAEEVLTELISENPEEIGGRIIIGKIYLGKGEKDKAVRVLNEVIGLDKNNAAASGLLSAVKDGIF